MRHKRLNPAMRSLVSAVAASLKAGRTSREVAARQMAAWAVPGHVVERVIS